MRKRLSALILMFGLSGCARPIQDPSPTVSPTVVSRMDKPQRFLPVNPSSYIIENIPWHGFFALDTETGQLCRTTTFQFTKGGTDFNSLPTCFSLSRDDPSSVTK